RMDHDQLVGWITDKKTSTNRRRLYFTMLGVCGDKDDIAMLEDFIRSGDRKKQAGLDALIACYLNLKGKDGLDLIVETFLRNEDVEYVDTLAAVSALRFHGTEVDFVPQKEIVKAIRTLLDRPKIADMIIPDLARWEDWSVMDRLVQMFKDANEETSWLRVPIASYLRACPKPEAKKYIEELREIDPDSIRRADFFLDFSDEESDDEQEADEKELKAPENSESKSPEAQQPVESKSDGQEKEAASERSASGTAQLEIYTTRKIPLESPAVEIDPNNSESLVVNQIPPESGVEVSLGGRIKPELTPIATSELVPLPARWKLIFFPMIGSFGILILLWSVISGWFDRLIY
ncbi:MAG: hypothetical protein AAGA30_20920, partial [Planctomycetota bacterium]